MVSVNSSYTANTRIALDNSMREASRAAIAMSTGEAIQHAYEDPTGLAIGSNMRANRDTLSIVATGIEQSQSMLYIAENELKAAYETATQMNQVLAKAKLGYMTDDLIKNTLSPTYVQLKEEFNRIADNAEFYGQKLLNGTGGIVNNGVQDETSNGEEEKTSISKNEVGKITTSTFKFVTGTDLNNDIIEVSFPNIRLDSKNGTLGIIETLNVKDAKTNQLSDLQSVKDADNDIPLIKALTAKLVVCLDEVGAYQKRFINLENQLTGAVEQLDLAQGAIMNANLPKESEINTRETVKVNIAISRLNAQNQMMYNLQKIVTG